MIRVLWTPTNQIPHMMSFYTSTSLPNTKREPNFDTRRFPVKQPRLMSTFAEKYTEGYFWTQFCSSHRTTGFLNTMFFIKKPSLQVISPLNLLISIDGRVVLKFELHVCPRTTKFKSGDRIHNRAHKMTADITNMHSWSLVDIIYCGI